MVGRENVYDSVNILLNADLTPWTAHRPAGLYFIENQKIRGTFLTINATDRWGFLINVLGPFGYTAKEPTPERSAELVRLAAGVPDLDVKILGSSRGPHRRSSPNSMFTDASSSQATRRMRCRQPAASVSIPACRTCTIWPGSSRRC